MLDPEMCNFLHEVRLATLQALYMYVLTGCDFTSVFTQTSKDLFLSALFRFAPFICSDSESLLGNLATTATASWHSFLRLVGVVYFLMNLTAFRNQFESPVPHYHSVSTKSRSPAARHVAWIETLNAKIWERVDSEDNLIPSIDALRFHWLRSRWVLLYWKQAQCIPSTTTNHQLWMESTG